MKYEKKANELKEWFINEKKADEKDFSDFLEYCLTRGLFNDSLMRRVFFTKANCEKLLKEFQSPIKRTAKLLGLNYKELGEQTGYNEGTLKNMVSTGNISAPLRKTLEYLVQNYELNKKLNELQEQIAELQSKRKQRQNKKEN